MLNIFLKGQYCLKYVLEGLKSSQIYILIFFLSRNSAELKQHVLAMHECTMYQCSFCPFKTSHQSSLKRHKQTVHPLAELKVYCDTCINTGAQMPPKAQNKEELRRILELADALQCEDCKNVSALRFWNFVALFASSIHIFRVIQKYK